MNIIFYFWWCIVLISFSTETRQAMKAHFVAVAPGFSVTDVVELPRDVSGDEGATSSLRLTP